MIAIVYFLCEKSKIDRTTSSVVAKVRDKLPLNQKASLVTFGTLFDFLRLSLIFRYRNIYSKHSTPASLKSIPHHLQIAVEKSVTSQDYGLRKRKKKA